MECALTRPLRQVAGVMLVGIIAALCVPRPAAAFSRNPEIDAFMQKLVTEHHFKRRQLQRWFRRAQLQPAVLDAISRPATASPWYQFRASHVTAARIEGGVEYWQRYAETLARASTEYAVPEEIIIATIGIETFYGRQVGSYNAFNSLATLAFAYPPRAELFRSELEEFLLLARELRASPLHYKGSYAGALGVAQFLPSSYRRYAVDFDGDGSRDLWNDQDAIGSIANFYKTHGWRPGELVVVAIEQPVDAANGEFKLLLERGLEPHATVAAIRRAGASPSEFVPDDALASVFSAETEAGPRYWLGFNNFYVITRYNRSVNYALAVYELALKLRRARTLTRFE